MGGSATITSPTANHGIEDEVTITGLRSTMMMPAKDLFQLETYLSRTLPKMDTISVQDGTLTLEGAGQGKIICKQV